MHKGGIIKMEDMWTNVKKVIESNRNKIKPCKKCGYCPYGAMVENFPLGDTTGFSCPIFGHDCPMYYNAEDVCVEVKE
jgi:hypothetical protein